VTARDRTLDLLAHRLNRAANTVPDIYDHLSEQRNYAPHLAAQDTSRPHGAGGIADPTLTTVIHLDEAGRRRQAIHDYIASIELGVKLLEQECRHALAWRMAQKPTDSETDARLALTPLCVDCKTKVPIARTLRTGVPIDDGRCIDCGPRADAEVYRRSDEEQQRRLRRYAHRHGGHTWQVDADNA
jgi:hypothetical protein